MGKLARAADVYGAPLAIVVCADRERAWRRPQDGKRTTDIDAAILTDHMMMEATDLGLGTVWICWFDPRTLAEQLSLPEELEPVNILAIGYADEPAADPERHACPLEADDSYQEHPARTHEGGAQRGESGSHPRDGGNHSQPQVGRGL